MHLNVQASNPCALLTQEHAKKFLHNGNEEDRYRFFLEAANMATRKVDLLSAKQNIDLLGVRLERAEKGMEEKREIAKATREEYEGAKQLKQARRARRHAPSQMPARSPCSLQRPRRTNASLRLSCRPHGTVGGGVREAGDAGGVGRGDAPRRDDR